MTAIFLLFLFVTQLISFYFIALLYTKLSKFDDLEKQQGNLMREMDDSIGAYLSELKDENDRLIEKLTTQEISKPEAVMKEATATVVKQSSPAEDAQSVVQFTTPKMPVKLALKSYNATSSLAALPEQAEMDDRTHAIQLHDAGHSIEKIAKKLKKGKTEIELILKFR